jgi:hypothetical protein
MTILLGKMRVKYLSHHAKAERGKCERRSESEAKWPAIVSSCQLNEMRNCDSSARQHILEEKLAHQLEENHLLHSHSGEFECEEGCADQEKTGHRAQTIEQQVNSIVT